MVSSVLISRNYENKHNANGSHMCRADSGNSSKSTYSSDTGYSGNNAMSGMTEHDTGCDV